MAKKQSEEKTVETRWTPDPAECPSYYVNFIELRRGPFDFRLKIGQALEIDRERAIIHAKTLASVFMSPQHAKSLMNLLKRNLESYEEKYGPIPDVESEEAEEPSPS